MLLTEPVRFTVPSHYADARIGDRVSWASFAEAVTAARSTIQRFEYPGQTPDHSFSRAFVALRQSNTMIDGELLRWEVFADRVELCQPIVDPDQMKRFMGAIYDQR